MNMELHIDLDGNEYMSQTGGSAGKVAQQSGANFEKLVAETIGGNVKTHQTAKGNITYTSPKYKNWVGAKNRLGDLILTLAGVDYHIECKNLAGCESHLQKLSDIYCNLRSKCYNLPFVLVYACNSNVPLAKMREVEGYLEKIREAGGLVFEFNKFIEWKR